MLKVIYLLQLKYKNQYSTLCVRTFAECQRRFMILTSDKKKNILMLLNNEMKRLKNGIKHRITKCATATNKQQNSQQACCKLGTIRERIIQT